MSLIIETVSAYLPPKRKHTPSGWTSFNAVCCHHNGDRADNRQRGGIMITDGVTYHCFNCGYKASWQPGRPLTTKFRKLLQWLNVTDELITKCSFEALRLKDEIAPEHKLDLIPTFFDKALPRGSKSILDWINEPPLEALGPVVQYLYDRGYTVDDYNWYWTDEQGFNDRLIIPFYYQNRLVGYTARLIRDGKIKYISEQQPGYVFNLDHQTYDRKFVIVCEGPLDAICVDGVAVMSNEISPQQHNLISKLQREVIVIPDQDQAGQKIIEQAIEWGWSVSFPNWEQDVKDVNDAVRKYGKIYTLWSILKNRESNALKIKLRTKL